MKTTALLTAALLLPLLSTTLSADDATPGVEELWNLIKAQQQEIDALKRKQAATDARATEADEKAEAAVVAVEESLATSSAAAGSGTTIGAYGELHYNNLEGSGGGKDKNEIDLHRFVLFFGHEFNDAVRMYSELEVEHGVAGDDQVGEVEVEQAYVEFDLDDRHRARLGVDLLPVGMLNETHEPATFYGVERNPVENNIIPATWWAGGIGLQGEIAPGWEYHAVLHEGLRIPNLADPDFKPTDFKEYAVRGGRQKTGKAKADDLAGTARIKWTGMPGTEVAATVQYQSDITQGRDPTAGHAWLYELHADVERGPFGLRALYARWDLDGSGPEAVGADNQEGYYIEPSYRFNDRLGAFTRYNHWDNQAGNSDKTGKQQIDIGLNWWPQEDVVLKADYQFQDNEDGIEQDGFNLGVGYQF